MLLWIVARIAFVLSALLLVTANIVLLPVPRRVRPESRCLKNAVTNSAFYVEMTVRGARVC